MQHRRAERIIRLAFDYAKKNALNKVTVVTKANVVKATDGKFLEVAAAVAKEYPEVEWDDWFIDILAAKLIDPARRAQFQVLVLPPMFVLSRATAEKILEIVTKAKPKAEEEQEQEEVSEEPVS